MKRNRKVIALTDLYDWILSAEIRDCLRAGRRLSFDEKAGIIHTAYRSLEEKREALRELLGEAESPEDREALMQVCGLYDRASAHLRGETPGQVFVCIGSRSCEPGETIWHGPVWGVFHTYGELMEYLENRMGYRIDSHTAPCLPDAAYGPEDISETARIEKWAYAGGRMECVISFGLFCIQGRCCFRDFLADLPGRKEVSGRAWELLHFDEGRNPLPLPFRPGDLACLDPPCWEEPLYGVLEIFDALGRYVNMHYMKGSGLRSISLTYWNIDLTPGLPVIHWLHHAKPPQLPDGQEPLAELSSGLHRLAGRDIEAAERVFLGMPKQSCSVQDAIAAIHSILKED